MGKVDRLIGGLRHGRLTTPRRHRQEDQNGEERYAECAYARLGRHRQSIAPRGIEGCLWTLSPPPWPVNLFALFVVAEGRSADRQGLGGGPSGQRDVGVGVRERHERRLELRGRLEHAAREHLVEVARVALRIGALGGG